MSHTHDIAGNFGGKRKGHYVVRPTFLAHVKVPKD